MNIREDIKKLITDAITQSGIEYNGEIVLDYPADMSMGDYATPIALKLGKQLGQKPQDVAESIVKGFGGVLPDFIERVDVAGPGFVNITLSKQYWSELHRNITHVSDKWGNNTILAGQKYLVEHSSPNMFKPFHVGHLVNNFVGAGVNNILRASGAETTVISYPSDVSPGIAKAVWGLIDKGWSEGFTMEQVGEAYAHGSTQYKEDDQVKQDIDAINLEIYQKQDTPAYAVYQKGLEQSFTYFKEITTRLGSTFADYIPESESEIEGKEIVHTHVPRVFIESDGAVVFEGSKYGLFDNVFINSAGYCTYLGKDIGLFSLKFKKFTFDRSITITDIEQKQHFQLVSKAAEFINKEWADKSTFIQHGRLALSSGKISSRDGGVPLAVDLVEEVRKKVVVKSQDKGIDDLEDMTEKVALSALKYAILKSAAGKNIVFDFEKDLSFEGASGPYIQYAYVRAQSALAKAGEVDTVQAVRVGTIPDLERLLVRFPDMVHKSLVEYSPHNIAVYLHELASEFNSFYAQTKIADDTNPDYQVNLALVRSFAQTIKNGLWLLGIETVEQM